MKNYKIYKFLMWFCFLGWIPFGTINPYVGAVMFLLFWIFLIIEKELKRQKLNSNISKNDTYYNLFQSYQNLVTDLIRKNSNLVLENFNLKLKNDELCHIKETNDMFPVVSKVIFENFYEVTFKVIYASGRRGQETVHINNDRFKELIKLTI